MSLASETAAAAPVAALALAAPPAGCMDAALAGNSSSSKETVAVRKTSLPQQQQQHPAPLPLQQQQQQQQQQSRDSGLEGQVRPREGHEEFEFAVGPRAERNVHEYRSSSSSSDSSNSGSSRPSQEAATRSLNS